MRVLFVTAPFKTHLYVQVPLASAFRTAGHDVRVAAAPDFVDVITGIGLTGVPIGHPVPMDVMLPKKQPDLGPDRTGLPVEKPAQSDYALDDPFAELADTALGTRSLYHHDDIFDDIVGLARNWRPDLVIRDPFMFAGGVAARAVGAVDVRMLWGADTLAQIRANCYGALAGQRRSEGRPDPLRDWLLPFLERYGCTYDEGVALGECTVIGWPSWAWRPQGVQYVPTRPVSFPGPHKVSDWVYDQSARKRICITQGISHRDYNFGRTASIDTLFEAVADLDAEVVATFDAKQIESVASVPDNVRVVDFVPFNAVMSTCSAIVHHGGYGTMASALEHGVPQLVVPNIFWKEKWWGAIALANGLEEQGAGAYVADADQMTAGLLRDHLVKALTDPAVADNAARLRAEYHKTPSPNETVTMFEGLVADRQRV